jgi:2-polyprenyl-6-methoxyphenol hydroxylase-like FAD-dependent oxidoreductase
MGREIRIIGGGLAGLTLGILLRRESVPVEIWEAGSFPRHRVCGEFISGRGIQILRSLEITGLPEPLGAFAQTARFYDRDVASPVLNLPDPALSIDRSQLDFLLAREFLRLGGVLHDNRRWTGSLTAEGTVRATGRRVHKGKDSAWIGVKAHATEVQLDSDLELHFSNRGYVGLSRLPHRERTFNVCALFRYDGELRVTRDADHLAESFTRGMGAPLVRLLERAKFIPETFSAVAGLSLSRTQVGSSAECRIGDSICMIPPLTGNGMSIALETAALSAPYLAAFSQERISWLRTLESTSQSCNSLLRNRLSAAGFLQGLSSHPVGRRSMLTALRTLPASFRLFFAVTH